MMEQQVRLPIDLYGRVSRKPQKGKRDRTRSVDGQLRDAEARVREAGLPVGRKLRDDGISAWNPRASRPDWDTLMERLETGVSGGVCVYELARFTRRPIEGERLIAAAERGLVVMSAESDFDLRRAEDRKRFRDLLVSAAYESDMTSSKTKRGKRLKAADGEPNHTWRPFGFEQDGVTHRQAEADAIRMAAQRIAAGEHGTDVAADLNAAGFTTSRGAPWDDGRLRMMLIRPRYAGYTVYQGHPVGQLPGESVLDEELWNRVVAVYASRRRGRPNSPRYLVSGLAQCGICLQPLTGRPRNNLAPYPDGEIKREYFCHSSGRSRGCGRVRIDQRALDAWARAFTAAVLSDREMAAARAAAADSRHAEVTRLREELRKLDELTETLAARLGRGEITLARHDAAVSPLDRRLAALRPLVAAAEATAVEAPGLPDVEPDQTAVLEHWDSASTSTETRRALLRGALNGDCLVVMPGRAVEGRMKVVPRDEVLAQP